MADKLTRDAFETHLQSIPDFDVTIDIDVTKTFTRNSEQLDLGRPTLAGTLPNLNIRSPSRSATDPELEVIGTLGEGGMAIVQLASQLALGREVAVKTPRRDRSSAKASRVLLHEAYVTGRLEHPNIVPVYMLGSDESGNPQIVMKRIEGTSWEELVGDRILTDDPAELTRHIEILLQVCNALRFAHDRGIIHRDIKPANVMIGDFDEVYLLDWGLAVSLRDDLIVINREDARGMCGTPAFMAPEMTNSDAADVDERTDVYLLGATLHWLLTGEHRHRGERLFDVMLSAWTSAPRSYEERVPNELAEIANRACRRDKDERFDSVEAFRDALTNYLEHRESIVLSQAAGDRREELERLLALSERTEDDELALHDMFGECRFGYAQALRMWPENEGARQGLQRILEAMAGHYLDQQNPVAAQACIAQLPERSPELEQRAATVASELEAEDANLERLKEIEADFDVDRGSASRSILALVFGIFWSLSTFRAAWLQSEGLVSEMAARQGHLNAGIRNIILVVILLFVFRKRLFVNRVNSVVMFMLGTLFASEFLIRFATWHTGASIDYARVVDETLFGFATVAIGLVTDRRLIWLSGFFYGSAIFGLLFPHYQLWSMGVSTMLVFFSAAWIWRPRPTVGAD